MIEAYWPHCLSQLANPTVFTCFLLCTSYQGLILCVYYIHCLHQNMFLYFLVVTSNTIAVQIRKKSKEGSSNNKIRYTD